MDVTPDAIAGRIAARQLGLLARADALSAGLSPDQIDGRLSTGRWQRVGPCVYVITGAPPGWQRNALAACLAADGAIASHLTAAALWGLAPPCPLPHVTVRPTGSARLPIARVHRSQVDHPDRTTIGSIPVSRIGRTIVDCAATVPGDVLRSIVDSSFDGGRCSPREVAAALGRAGRGIRGRSALREAMEPWTDPIVPGSPAEARLLRRLAQWGLEPPIRQFPVCDASGTTLGVVDLAWPAAWLGVEYDGSIWHSPRHFEHDERRHARITALGWRLIHTDRLDLRPGDERLRRELEAAKIHAPAA